MASPPLACRSRTVVVLQNGVTFAAFKELWRRRRLSAAFHVEFWESTPTLTHQTVLQTALGALLTATSYLLSLSVA